MVSILGNFSVSVICLDDYHLNDRAARKESGKTALHADEQNFDLIAQHLVSLKRGQYIWKPVYDHQTGKFRNDMERIDPNKVILVEGLHPLYDERIRNIFDFTIYIDAADTIKQKWKISRDIKRRGYSKDEVIAEIEKK